MRRLPVLGVIREAYAFTFSHLGAVIGLIWLPMVIATVGDFFVTQHYGRQVSQALAAGNPGAAGPAVLVQLGFFLVRLLLYAVMYVPVAQLALGQRQSGAVAHFAFGAPEWRMFRALLGLTVLFFIGVMLLSLLAGAAGALTPQSLFAEVGGLLFLFGIIYVGVRMGYLVPAIVVAEEGPALTRAWILSAGNFWRLLGVLVGTLGPLLLLLALALLMVIYGSLDMSKPPTMQAVSAAASANLPLTMGAQFLVAPLLIALMVGASVFSWKALNQNGARADIRA